MEEALQEIKESLKTLPSHIREVVTQTKWAPKIDELALKYSLTDDQKRALFTEVLLVLVAINPEEDIVENIENELGVSGILAEQLAEEVGERIFSWIYKLYTEKENAMHQTKNQNSLDIPPPNLPGEIIEEEISQPTQPEPLFAHADTQTHEEAVKEFFTTPKEDMVKAEKPLETPPSFTPAMEKPFVPQTPRSFIAQKLSQPSTLATPPNTPKTYPVDPYREPLD